MIKKWSMSYPAVNGTEQRRAYVYLPTMYEAQPERRFPVLYMFDGQNVFFNEDATYGKSWGVADYLDYTCLLYTSSCRAYEPRQITDAELDAVLEAGTYAASAMGRQSAKIVVVQDAATRAQLTRMNAAVMGADSDPMYGAPTILVVLADAHANCAVQDGSLVMGNLMLAAASLGLGSCWINRAREEFDSAEGKALLKKWGIEGDWIGVGHCILGYPAAEPKPAAPRKPDYIVRV